MRRYHAAPAWRSQAPGQAFATLREAQRWAERMALQHRTDYCLWQIEGRRLRLVKRLMAPPAVA